MARLHLQKYDFRLDVLFNNGRSVSYINADFYQKSLNTPRLHHKFALVLFGSYCASTSPTLTKLEDIVGLRLVVLNEQGFDLKSQTYLY